MRSEKGFKQIYQTGTVVYSKMDRSIKLSVLKYSNGIYYCAVIGNAEKNNLPYLESQLGDE